jgi:hypothetical protein
MTARARVPGPTSTKATVPVPHAADATPGRAPVRSASEPILQQALTSSARPLDTDVRESMEARFGHDFSNVRIHADSRASESARALDAAAFTVGKRIVFDSGRYAPASREGALLLAHELAHVAHGARASERRSGVAPQTASAERHADHAAAAVLASSRTGRFAPDLDQWGPAWEIHRQVDNISKKGTVAHSGEVGRKPGETGVPTGAVEVRTGEEIEFTGGAKFPNVISLAYTGALSADTHWLQYVWFELVATTPKGEVRGSGSLPFTGGVMPLAADPKAPTWSIDTAASNPFYEAAGANLRDASSITVFDAPGGGTAAGVANTMFAAGLGATAVTLTGHFETYLIQSNYAAYVVRYQASTAFTKDSTGKTIVGAIGYTVGASGQVTALPADRKTLLDAKYPTFKNVK